MNVISSIRKKTSKDLEKIYSLFFSIPKKGIISINSFKSSYYFHSDKPIFLKKTSEKSILLVQLNDFTTLPCSIFEMVINIKVTHENISIPI